MAELQLDPSASKSPLQRDSPLFFSFSECCAFVQPWAVEQVHAARKIRQTRLSDLLLCVEIALREALKMLSFTATVRTLEGTFMSPAVVNLTRF
jgi:hypothetical protein